jgi:hypothetical protein
LTFWVAAAFAPHQNDLEHEMPKMANRGVIASLSSGSSEDGVQISLTFIALRVCDQLNLDYACCSKPQTHHKALALKSRSDRNRLQAMTHFAQRA